MDCKVLMQISLKGVSPTGKTKHFSGNKILPPPLFLQIGKYEGDSGFYLFYLIEKMECLTDTYHDTLQGAIDQAEWEFDIQFRDWEIVNSE